ncbi:MAG: hypothetical protein NTV02_00880, partial [Candidatus Zambryskibacteria bacterium]|nr:hypothetical protein [Candidatus Zambryskibacteria bacterium]
MVPPAVVSPSSFFDSSIEETLGTGLPTQRTRRVNRQSVRFQAPQEYFHFYIPYSRLCCKKKLFHNKNTTKRKLGGVFGTMEDMKHTKDIIKSTKTKKKYKL